jgi:type IV pilus assembly protein PilB
LSRKAVTLLIKAPSLFDHPPNQNTLDPLDRIIMDAFAAPSHPPNQTMNSQQIADLFVDQRILQPAQVDDILQEANLNGKSIERALIDSGFVDQRGFYQVIANALGTDFIDLAEDEIAPETLRLIPAGLARLHQALPIAAHENTLRVALLDPLDLRAVEDLRFALGRDVHVVVAPTGQVEDRIKLYYGADSSSMEEILKQLGETGELMTLRDAADSASIVEAEANATPVIRFVDLILFQAIQDRASDIHFEPFENEFKIRYRVDGALYEMAPPPRHLALPIISRVKVMANMNIAERRLPQDGRIQKNIAGRAVDLRVSTLPTQFGESVVLRVLDRSTVNLDLEALGLPDHIHDYLIEIVHRPNGIFIVTGPTGSGKTTTLYSCLRKINTIDSKLLTAEEPVEYDLDGIVQVPVNEAIGLTFARVLRAFLRQDPDRIMVGETRDLETAQISIQAALTGHLVFTTLHTNDAPGAITRLIDMGVEPFLISSTLEAVLGQRLLRSICPRCRTPYQPSDTLLVQLGLSRPDIGEKNFYYGKGCDACNQTGYSGRKGIYELLKITDPLRELINERAPSVTLKEKALELGMVTLRQDGLRSVFAGDTTIEEVLKYT